MPRGELRKNVLIAAFALTAATRAWATNVSHVAINMAQASRTGVDLRGDMRRSGAVMTLTRPSLQ